MMARARNAGQDKNGDRYERRAHDADQHAKLLRSVLRQGGAELE